MIQLSFDVARQKATLQSHHQASKNMAIPVTRRTTLALLVQSAATAFASPVKTWDERRASNPPVILLRSSWQVVNIGDIAHTPGVLALLEKYIPEAQVILWASANLTDEVAALERRRFPNLKIVKGSIGQNGIASNSELSEAIKRADFLLHGSGPSLVAAKDLAAWIQHVKKPFGIYGITHGSFQSGTDREIIAQAKFVYFRDSASLEVAKSEKVQCPIMGFAPDGAFACDLRDDITAQAFLDANDLEPGKFLCCLSRLRFTPYWSIPGDSRKFDPQKHIRNEQMKEHDHKPIREAIVNVVRETAMKVLLCPEDATQMAVGKELLFDKLPDDVRKRVIWRSKFWLTDDAISVYVRSAGLFGSEMHSPIMALGNRVPAIVCRFKEQTTKGLMWKDIGLGDWLFDFDVEANCQRLPAAVFELAQDPSAARTKVAAALEFVHQKQAETMQVLRNSLSLG